MNTHSAVNSKPENPKILPLLLILFGFRAPSPLAVPLSSQHSQTWVCVYVRAFTPLEEKQHLNNAPTTPSMTLWPASIEYDELVLEVSLLGWMICNFASWVHHIFDKLCQKASTGGICPYLWQRPRDLQLAPGCQRRQRSCIWKSERHLFELQHTTTNSSEMTPNIFESS